MRTAGVIGIGNMGSGLAKNLIKNGYQVSGVDPKPDRMKAFVEMGGHAAANPAEVGRAAQAVFVMVMTGDEAKAVILGPDGLVSHMPRGGAVILSATIKPREAREIGAAIQGSDIHLIDTPVSGGYPGAQGGFNRSSQHPIFGGVDDKNRQTKIRTFDTGQIKLARKAASLAT